MLNARINLVLGLLSTVFVGSVTIAIAKFNATTPTPLEHFKTTVSDLAVIDQTIWAIPKSRAVHKLIQARGDDAPGSIPLAAFLDLRAELANISPPQSVESLARLRLTLDKVASLLAAKQASKDITFNQLEGLYTPKISLSWLGGVTVTLPGGQWFLLGLALATYLLWWSTLSTLNKKLEEGASGDDLSASLFFGSGGASLVVALSILLVPILLVAGTGPYPWRYAILLAGLLVMPWWSVRKNLKPKPTQTNVPSLAVTNVDYPNLEFSLTNSGTRSLHITHVWCIALSRVVDGLQTMRYATGPKIQFRFNVGGDDQRVNVLGNQQINLEPNEAQAFDIEVEAVNCTALFAVHTQSIDPKTKQPQTIPADCVFLVSAPADQPLTPGEIFLIEKKVALDALRNNANTLIDVRSNPINVAWQDTLMRGAAELFGDNAADELDQLLTARPTITGPALASVAEHFSHSPHLESLLPALEQSISDPNQLYALGGWDDGAFGSPIAQLLLDRTPRKERVNYCLAHLDQTHRLPDVNSSGFDVTLEEASVAAHEAGYAVTRSKWLIPLTQEVGIGSVEYLMMLLNVLPNMKRDIDKLLTGLITTDRPDIEPGHDPIPAWQTWWALHKNESMTTLNWRDQSPTLAEADTLISAAEQSDELNPLVASRNILARSWASRQVLSETNARTLSQDPEERIRFQLAVNETTPTTIIESMSQDAHDEVRLLLVFHLNQTKSGLEHLSSDANREVAESAQERLANWPDDEPTPTHGP